MTGASGESDWARPPAMRFLGPALRWVGGLGILAVAAARCVIVFAPQVVFDVDPAIDPAPLAGLGPSGSLALDALGLAACGLGLAGEILSRRRLEWLLLVAALAPLPVVLFHGSADLGDLWRGSTWVVAASSAAVIAHLGRDPRLRRVLLALLVALLVPIAVRGVSQSAVSLFGISLTGAEHSETVREFQANRAEFFADRGWRPDSAAARIYERRLRQAEPRGWFPSANIFASLMAVGLVLSAGLALRTRDGPWRLGLLCVGGVVGAGLLLLAGSKGGMTAAAVGLGLLGAVHLSQRHREARARPRAGSVVAIGIVGGMLLAVVVRGTLLPESFLGDRSLLFRWHYLQGAAGVIASEGVVGVGPDGFQGAYVAHRPPRSPEEVTSAHNAFADWGATLGLSGAAWIALLLVLLWRAGSLLVPGSASGERPPTPSMAHGALSRGVASTTLISAAAVAVVALVPAVVVEAQSLGTFGVQLARMGGVVGYIIVAAGLGHVLQRLGPTAINQVLAAAAVALGLHGMIEMIFFDPGSAVWVMCVVGLAGARSNQPPADDKRRPALVVGLATCVVLFAASVWLGGVVSPRLDRQQARMILAARSLHESASGSGRRPDARARQQAAADLLDAYRIVPWNHRPLEEAVRQLLLAADVLEGDRRGEVLGRAIELSERAVREHERLSSIALAATAWRLEALATGSQEAWQRAIAHSRRLTELDPHGIASWRRLADICWAAGRRGDAAAAYERALQADRNFGLDPLKQLSDRDRGQIQERLRTTRSG